MSKRTWFGRGLPGKGRGEGLFALAVIAAGMVMAGCGNPAGDGDGTGNVTANFTTPALYRTMVRLFGGQITGSGFRGVFISGRTVTLSAFSIAKYETTYELWYEVRKWAADNNEATALPTMARKGMMEPVGLNPHQGQRLNR
jgi:hypothetical protein